MKNKNISLKAQFHILTISRTVYKRVKPGLTSWIGLTKIPNKVVGSLNHPKNISKSFLNL